MHRENLQYAAIFLICGPKLIDSPHFAAQARIVIRIATDYFMLDEHFVKNFPRKF